MLDREEWIEQAHLFRSLAERIVAGVATQEALAAIAHEVLAEPEVVRALAAAFGPDVIDDEGHVRRRATVDLPAPILPMSPMIVMA